MKELIIFGALIAAFYVIRPIWGNVAAILFTVFWLFFSIGLLMG